MMRRLLQCAVFLIIISIGNNVIHLVFDNVGWICTFFVLILIMIALVLLDSKIIINAITMVMHKMIALDAGMALTRNGDSAGTPV